MPCSFLIKFIANGWTFPKTGFYSTTCWLIALSDFRIGFLEANSISLLFWLYSQYRYVAVGYDKIESPLDALDDVISANFIKDLVNWSKTDPLLSQIADTGRVYLIGHSRGGKVSVLAAQQDSRVAALCLIDPVDNTVYAPLAPG